MTTSEREQKSAADDFQPYVGRHETVAEFTFKSVAAGIIFGILFGAANAYLGLLVGLTVSTSIPVAVMTVAFFRLTKRLFGSVTILESNMSQTVGSASSSLASGVIFTIPALFLWGLDPTLFQMTGLAMLGGLLGILFMIPLRKLLIKDEHQTLPYPEGTACAKVLIASEAGKSKATNIFLGLGIGAVYKLLNKFLLVLKSDVSVSIPFLPKGQIGLLATPALLAVGYILGFRISAIMVSGSLISWVILIPILAWLGDSGGASFLGESASAIAGMTPSQIWSRYIRYVGAGAVAAGGIATIIRSIPTMISSFKIVMSEMS
ncbi:MAG: OPT/YSL family transporter, partial [candidate division Zixibacteria bacterium]